MDNSLLLYEQQYFYKVCLLRITVECKSKKLKETKNLLDLYLKINPKFENTINCKFLKNIITVIDDDVTNKNSQEFHQLIFKHDISVKIPSDELILLNKIRNSL